MPNISLTSINSALEKKMDATDSSSNLTDVLRLAKSADNFSSTVFYIDSNYYPTDSAFIGTLARDSDGTVLAYDGTSWTRPDTNGSLYVAPPPFYQGENYGYATAGQNPSGIPQGANIIEKYSFTSDGNATDVGDLTTTTRSTSGMSSSTHGYTSIGFPQSSDDINKFAFASDGNASNIGTTFSRTYLGAGHSSETNGYASGGTSPIAANTNEIKRFPFSAEATTVDVGDLTVGRSETTGTMSTNHGYHVGGNGPSNVIDKFAFATDGNATDVGDMTEGRTGAAASASTTHGYASCGDNYPAGARARNTIDKFAFASDGNATDVGDAYHARSFLGGGTSSTSSGYAAGGRGSTSTLGNTPSISNYLDTIDKFSFASDGNGTDVGNLTVGRREVTGQQY